MAVAICNFVRFKTKDGAYIAGRDYQNFYINSSRAYAGVTYAFVPLGVTTGGGKKGGDRGRAAIVAPPGPIAVNFFAEACDNRYIAEIRTVEVDPITLTTLALIARDRWLCTGLESRVDGASLTLSSPLDAVDGQVPRRVLSSYLVGSLPTSGNITIS